jgi:hypothetical protein
MQTALLTLALIILTAIVIRVFIMWIAVEKDISEWNKLTSESEKKKEKPPIDYNQYDTPAYHRPKKARLPVSPTPLHGRLVLKDCQDKIDRQSPFN